LSVREFACAWQEILFRILMGRRAKAQRSK
jgi:hypothetical protein